MKVENYKYSDITQVIIGAFYKVYNALGYGFLEKVYVNSLLIELRKSGLICETQYQITVYYDEQEVGFYIADIIANGCIIIEVKATEALCEAHEFQLVNYLKATEIEVGLLLNFGKKPECKRKVYSNNYQSTDDVDLSDMLQ